MLLRRQSWHNNKPSATWKTTFIRARIDYLLLLVLLPSITWQKLLPYMKAATINTLKQQLERLPAEQLITLCLRLARFKKDNKELLTYLLFEADDNQGYIENVKKEIDELFSSMN